MASETVGLGLATLVGPAHTHHMKRSYRSRIDAMEEQWQAILSLNYLKEAIRKRELDSPAMLEQIISELNAHQFQDMKAAKLSKEVIEAAHSRKKELTYPLLIVMT